MSVPAPPRPAAARLLSPRFRLALLLVLLAAAATAAVVLEPQRLFAPGRGGWPVSGGAAVVLFAAAYGLATVAFVPRPVLNVAAGALFGSQFGTAAAIVGTVLGAGIAFGLGRSLGQEALRPMLRGRWLRAADRQLSRHGFRSMLAIRLFPAVPFAGANYCAAVSRMSWPAFLLATGIGSVPNTAAYVIAGSKASDPGSPAFLFSTGFIVVTGLAGLAFAWRERRRLRRARTHGAAGPVRRAGPEPVRPLGEAEFEGGEHRQATPAVRAATGRP
ncbi:TVP38/TMEM64 family protein [Streptomyces pathocidini]|uniref:TVP38/TMEM64 family membrane protein n=1 Tax=Streptomyces pathocidini TaxID=1650571 RepID=A0ABW7UXG4_9ACTN